MDRETRVNATQAGLSEKVPLLTSEGDEADSHAYVQVKSISARGHSQCKGEGA